MPATTLATSRYTSPYTTITSCASKVSSCLSGCLHACAAVPCQCLGLLSTEEDSAQCPVVAASTLPLSSLVARVCNRKALDTASRLRYCLATQAVSSSLPSSLSLSLPPSPSLPSSLPVSVPLALVPMHMSLTPSPLWHLPMWGRNCW